MKEIVFVALLLLAVELGSASRTIIITGNTTAGTWFVNGNAPDDLLLVLNATTIFSIEGEGIDFFFVGPNITDAIGSCTTSPCSFSVNITDENADLIFGLDETDSNLYRDILLGTCDSLLSNENECDFYPTDCFWCQSSLQCFDSTLSSNLCSECSTVSLTTCGNVTTSPGCSYCSSTGTCHPSSYNCPICIVRGSISCMLNEVLYTHIDTSFVVKSANAIDCDVSNGQINITAPCTAYGCTFSSSPSIAANAVPGIGWNALSVLPGTYSLTVSLTGCRTTIQVNVGPTTCLSSSFITTSELSNPDDQGSGIEWWAWLILGVGIVVIAAIVIVAIVIGRRIANAKRNNAFFSANDENLAVLGGSSGNTAPDRF